MIKLILKILFTPLLMLGILANSFVFLCCDNEKEGHLESIISECSTESCSKTDFASHLEFGTDKCTEKNIIQDNFLTEKEYSELDLDKAEEKYGDYSRLSEKESFSKGADINYTSTLQYKIITTTSLLI